LRAKIEEIEANSEIHNIRDLYGCISDIKKGYHPRCHIVKEEKVDQFADTHNIVVRWRNSFSKLFNVHGVKDDEQAEIHTAEPQVPEPSSNEFDLAIAKLKSHKSPGIDEIPAELTKTEGGTIGGEIHKLITSIWKKGKLPKEWKKSIILPIQMKGDETFCNILGVISILPTTYKILSNILLSTLTPYAKEIIVDHQCGFRRNRSTIDRIFCIRQIFEKKWEYNE